MTRFAIHDQQRPLKMWPAGAQMATDTRNSLMTKSVSDVPPAVAFFDKPIDVSHFRVPLCDAYAYIERDNRNGEGGTDLDERRKRMVLAGYDDNSRTRRLLHGRGGSDSEDEPPAKRVRFAIGSGGYVPNCDSENCFQAYSFPCSPTTPAHSPTP